MTNSKMISKRLKLQFDGRSFRNENSRIMCTTHKMDKCAYSIDQVPETISFLLLFESVTGNLHIDELNKFNNKVTGWSSFSGCVVE